MGCAHRWRRDRIREDMKEWKYGLVSESYQKSSGFKQHRADGICWDRGR